jgi:hypothetical protein
VVLQLTVFWYIGAVLGHVCLGLGVLAWGPCCSVGFSFSPNGALEFVLFCGRLAVSQYNFLFIQKKKKKNSGLRLLVGCGMASSMPSMFAVFRELSCAPVAASALAARCRAFLKYPDLSTWIATLIVRPPPRDVCAGTWVTPTQRLAAKCEAKPRILSKASRVHGVGQCDRLELLEAVVYRVFAAEWASCEDANKSVTARGYREGAFVKTSMAAHSEFWLPTAGSSMVHLLRARVGAFVTDSRAVHFGSGGAADGGVCRFCDSGDVESLSHVLVRCSKWDPLRRSLLHGLLREGVELLSAVHVPASLRASSENLTTLLLGGAVSGVRLSAWASPPDGASGVLEDDAASAAVSDDLSAVSTMSGVSSASGAVPGDFCFQLQGCYAVARFLERVSVLRRPGVVV